MDFFEVKAEADEASENNLRCSVCGDTGILEFDDYDEDGNLVTGKVPCFCTRELKGE